MNEKTLILTKEVIEKLQELQNLKPKLRELFTIIFRKYGKK